MVSKYSMDEIKDILSKRTMPGSSVSFLGKSVSVMIYGAGNCGRDLLAILTEKGIPVSCFLDGNIPAGNSVMGMPVFHPDDAAVSVQQRKRVCVVIAIFNAYVDIVPVTRKLKEYGYTNIVTFPEIHRHFPKELGDRFWLTSTDYYDLLDPVIAEGLQVWHDEESRALYKAILEFRCTGDYTLLPSPEKGRAYFDSGLPIWETPMRFIDCGSFDGDTLKALQKSYGKVDMVAAFEPDPENFKSLSRLVKTVGPQFADQTFLYPCGVWSQTTQLRFAAGAANGSHISPSGEILVQCTSLDEALPDFCPTLIKMDIEGAEYQALLGAREVILAHRPGLAVCLYHRPEHLWQIPLLAREWLPHYRFYLRAYYYAGFELVMYAKHLN
jgi:FkbM family methyltransferase